MSKWSGVEVVNMGFNNTGYPGAFTQPIIDIIEKLIYGHVLNLYSGQSLIGDTRVDIEHPNATVNMLVREFLEADKDYWDWVILDPPYQITRTDAKLNGYGIKGAISSDVIMRRAMKFYLQRHTDNILWLDNCAPMIKGFGREKLWLVLPGGFHAVRVLSWLKINTRPLL